MHLLLKRSQHDAGLLWTEMVFELDASLDLSPEERQLFEKYGLYDRVVYNSDAFLQHLHSADHHRQEAAKDDSDLLTIAYNSINALGYNMLGKLSLQITLQNLIDGVHIESHDLEEILTVEKLIHQSTGFLADYLNVALTFDGSEELDEY